MLIHDNGYVLEVEKLKKQVNDLNNFIKDYYIYIKKKASNESQLMIEQFYKKYRTFFNIDRFCIPIIGEISSGKSTFLNYLLKLNGVLQTDKNITTKFFTIIRHNKNLKQPKIYEVEKLDIRHFYKYNFIKGKLIEGNVSSIIKERNDKIKIDKMFMNIC